MPKLIKVSSISNSKGDIDTIYVNIDQIQFFYRTDKKDFGVDHNRTREVTLIRLTGGELHVEESVENISASLQEIQNA
jgi:hypothetical protein